MHQVVEAMCRVSKTREREREREREDGMDGKITLNNRELRDEFFYKNFGDKN